MLEIKLLVVIAGRVLGVGQRYAGKVNLGGIGKRGGWPDA